MIAETRKKIENNRKVWDSENINKKQKKRTEKKKWWRFRVMDRWIERNRKSLCPVCLCGVCFLFFVCVDNNDDDYSFFVITYKTLSFVLVLLICPFIYY
jgi:hypothetical protein